jgi:hypothetical protein
MRALKQETIKMPCASKRARSTNNLGSTETLSSDQREKIVGAAETSGHESKLTRGQKRSSGKMMQ